MGRNTRLPPQLGQSPPSLWSAQSLQNVHSKVQIIASVAVGCKSLSQHSQLGRNSSIFPLTVGNFKFMTLSDGPCDLGGLPEMGGPRSPGLVEGLDGCRFVVFYVEDGVELGDLQE